MRVRIHRQENLLSSVLGLTEESWELGSYFYLCVLLTDPDQPPWKPKSSLELADHRDTPHVTLALS